MQMVLVSIALIIYSIYSALKIKRYLHMLQLNSYFNNRYLSWLRNNALKELQIVELLALSTIMLLFWGKAWAASATWFIVYAACTIFGKKDGEKKKFVVTSRVKRLIFTVCLLYLVCLSIFIVCSISGSIFTICMSGLVLVILTLVQPLAVVLANTVNMPVERLISNWYKNDAKNLIGKMNNLQVIGITGSYGKTSTKYILNEILGRKFNVLMTPESYNTTMGVVKTIRTMLKPIHEIFIVEMGAKKKGDIKEICELVSPRYGLLTSIGPQHLESFKSIENIINTKFELVDSLPQDGTAFLNYDNKYIIDREHVKNKIIYGITSEGLDYRAEKIQFGSKGTTFDLCIHDGRRIELATKLLGTHNVLNIAAASAVACELGVEPEKIKFAVKMLKPVPHRLELKNAANGSFIIDDSYNSNPEGAKAALEVLGKFDSSNKILITPGIIELGEKEYECNFEFGRLAAGVCDFIILVGPVRTKPIFDGIQAHGYVDEKMHIARNLNDALGKMRQLLTDGSVVLFENDLPDNYNE